MATDDDADDARFDLLLADYHEVVSQGVDEASFWKAAGDLPDDLRKSACRQPELACANCTPPGTGRKVQPWRSGRISRPYPYWRLGHQRNRIGSVASASSRELGRGGNGMVLLGVDPHLGRRLAIKVPLPEVLVHPELRQRFLRKAEVTARLRHSNLLTVYESGEAGPVCFIAAEYCAGPNLSQWLQAQRHVQPPTIAAITNLMIQLAEGVQHAHARGVLHRDLKPSNILLDPVEGWRVRNRNRDPHALPLSEYVPKISDFGLAKLLEAKSEQLVRALCWGRSCTCHRNRRRGVSEIFLCKATCMRWEPFSMSSSPAMHRCAARAIARPCR